MINKKEYFGVNITREEMIDSILVEHQRREGGLEVNLLVLETVLGCDDWTDEKVQERYNEMF